MVGVELRWSLLASWFGHLVVLLGYRMGGQGS